MSTKRLNTVKLVSEATNMYREMGIWREYFLTLMRKQADQLTLLLLYIIYITWYKLIEHIYIVDQWYTRIDKKWLFIIYT